MGRFACLLLLLAPSAACRPAGPESAAQPPALRPVTLPDISTAAESVQRQIRERHQALQAIAARSDAPAAARASAYGELGKLLTAAEYFDAAEACFLNAQQLAPQDMRWPYFLGHVARYRNDQTAAIAFFEQSLARAPEHVPSLVWLAEMNLALSRPDAAKGLLDRARAIDPSSPAVIYGLGRVALARDDYATAVTLLEEALAKAPQATRVHYPLALAYRGIGNASQAAAHLRLRGDVDLLPSDTLLAEVSGQLQNAAAYETRGSQALDARQWAEAAEHLRRAAELAPANAFTRLNLGTALYMLGDGDGALAQYREAVRLQPTLARAHFGIGVLMESRGRDPDAIAAFTRAVDSDAGYAEARFALANALRRSGRVEDSLLHYAEVLRTNPAVSQAAFGYAMGLVRLGRYQEARARLEAAATSFPDQLGFAHALARLLAAAPDDRVRDGARAHVLVSKLLETQRTIALTETMAMAQAEVGRFDEAARWQREAIEGARQSGRADLAAQLARNLQLYQAGRPCRMPWTDDDPVHRPAGSDQP